MILRKQTREQSLKDKYHNKWWKKFAWFPVRLVNGQTIWLESYWQHTLWGGYFDEVDQYNCKHIKSRDK